MRFIQEQISGQEKTRYIFAFGKEEATILHALIVKAIRYMPRTMETQATEARMRNMEKEIREAVDIMKTRNVDTYIRNEEHTKHTRNSQ
ncbi:MAG: hypothetical protein KJI69_05095 [Patescibacteria group bacterium]|nr:hypothetical protein [Patescibacteria group bacterium]